ncbi:MULTISPECIES: hypothetical protein [unclassified Mesobacillus]|uniref:hypothetical protein n=1 Tax=unclassified Mesobacillus TaxID=2675270 RepID=UPI002041F14C|nr:MULTISPECIES: hypothetical protein [unclassified Mesobacillus]MCM3125002.1 hypothetical protein [Mesobacillus sp. MER 33]MCM3235238.1 hypothetical protein [Mesobacillus sp. MER 48]
MKKTRVFLYFHLSARLILSEMVTSLQWLEVCIILLSAVLNEAGTCIYLGRN